jgi:hypothetical protein
VSLTTLRLKWQSLRLRLCCRLKNWQKSNLQEKTMLDKLQAIEDKYLDLEAKISDPDIIADQKEWQKCTKAHAKLTDIVTVFREYRDLVKAKNDAEEIIAAGDDRELTEMAYDELKELKPQLAVYEERLTVLLLPSDPNDDKDVIVEILIVPAVQVASMSIKPNQQCGSRTYRQVS